MRRLKIRLKLGTDILMLIAFLVNMFTGFVIFFGFVSGGGRQYAGAGGVQVANLLDLSAKAWYRLLHDWSGIIFIALILVHLILNWNTLACYFRNMIRSAKIAKTQKSCENTQ